MPTQKIFKVIEQYIKQEVPADVVDFLSNTASLQAAFDKIDAMTANNYLYGHFILWLSHYAHNAQSSLQDYFNGKVDLGYISSNFINFCFKNKIVMNADETLCSFKMHNQLSDNAVKKELIKMSPKSNINLLGFGLDDGAYEKELANYLITQGLCTNVTIYGMDPYAKKGIGVHYLNPYQLITDTNLKFDAVIARWSLHHVANKDRWFGLIHCINRCNPGARVIFIEHGFLSKNLSLIRKKLYELLNATFDIIANIGLRPNYFTQTAPEFGAHFFIRYLGLDDYMAIANSQTQIIVSQDIYEVGPSFPNQTICSFCISK
ncbi:MAG: hypothetical protein V4471_00650 [Pseudomonadota bacterium]